MFVFAGLRQLFIGPFASSVVRWVLIGVRCAAKALEGAL